MAAQQATAELLACVAPVVSDAGLDLEDLEVVAAGRRRIVRVLVDKDGGVSLDLIAALTHVVGASLESSDAIGGLPYTLEVTSPGIDRPLTAPRHWRRNVGRLVKVTTTDGTVRTGRITTATDEAVTVERDGSEERLGYDQVARAQVQVEFNRPSNARRAQ